MVVARVTVTVPRGHAVTINGIPVETTATAVEISLLCETDGGAPITLGLVDAQVPVDAG